MKKAISAESVVPSAADVGGLLNAGVDTAAARDFRGARVRFAGLPLGVSSALATGALLFPLRRLGGATSGVTAGELLVIESRTTAGQITCFPAFCRFSEPSFSRCAGNKTNIAFLHSQFLLIRMVGIGDALDTSAFLFRFGWNDQRADIIQVFRRDLHVQILFKRWQ